MLPFKSLTFNHFLIVLKKIKLQHLGRPYSNRYAQKKKRKKKSHASLSRDMVNIMLNDEQIFKIAALVD